MNSGSSCWFMSTGSSCQSCGEKVAVLIVLSSGARHDLARPSRSFSTSKTGRKEVKKLSPRRANFGISSLVVGLISLCPTTQRSQSVRSLSDQMYSYEMSLNLIQKTVPQISRSREISSQLSSSHFVFCQKHAQSPLLYSQHLNYLDLSVLIAEILFLIISKADSGMAMNGQAT